MTLQEMAQKEAARVKDTHTKANTPIDAVDVEEAIVRVASENNLELLGLYKERGAEIARLADEVTKLTKESDLHSEWRRAANKRVRDLEQQLSDAASAGDEYMTKRERFVAVALQGCGPAVGWNADEAVRKAIEVADKVIFMLEAKL